MDWPKNTFVRPMLKYLFDVEFLDGTTYTQNWEDISVIEPGKRSCFYDVMQLSEQGKQIKYFMLSDGKDVYLVDLTDGHFEINGKSFFVHDRRDLKNFRIVFYRQHDHSFDANQKEIAHEITFCFGWQTNDENGNNIKRIIEIK